METDEWIVIGAMIFVVLVGVFLIRFSLSRGKPGSLYFVLFTILLILGALGVIFYGLYKNKEPIWWIIPTGVIGFLIIFLVLFMFFRAENPEGVENAEGVIYNMTEERAVQEAVKEVEAQKDSVIKKAEGRRLTEKQISFLEFYNNYGTTYDPFETETPEGKIYLTAALRIQNQLKQNPEFLGRHRADYYTDLLLDLAGEEPWFKTSGKVKIGGELKYYPAYESGDLSPKQKQLLKSAIVYETHNYRPGSGTLSTIRYDFEGNRAEEYFRGLERLGAFR